MKLSTHLMIAIVAVGIGTAGCKGSPSKEEAVPVTNDTASQPTPTQEDSQGNSEEVSRPSSVTPPEPTPPPQEECTPAVYNDGRLAVPLIVVGYVTGNGPYASFVKDTPFIVLDDQITAIEVKEGPNYVEGDHVEVFAYAHYQGTRMKLEPGSMYSLPSSMSGKISSIKIVRPDVSPQKCADGRYEGKIRLVVEAHLDNESYSLRQQFFEAYNTDSLSLWSMDNEISYVTIHKGPHYRDGDWVEFCDLTRYDSGANTCWSGQPGLSTTLHGLPSNDAISSISFFGADSPASDPLVPPTDDPLPDVGGVEPPAGTSDETTGGTVENPLDGGDLPPPPAGDLPQRPVGVEGSPPPAAGDSLPTDGWVVVAPPAQTLPTDPTAPTNPVEAPPLGVGEVGRPAQTPPTVETAVGEAMEERPLVGNIPQPPNDTGNERPSPTVPTLSVDDIAKTLFDKERFRRPRGQ